jgi:Cu2+-exporting ATPase
MESPADTISETSNEPPVKSCCSSNKPQEKPTVISPDNARKILLSDALREKRFMINGRLSRLWNGFGKRSGVTNSKMVYTCPMHPEVVQEGPGSCPICGMDLVPMEPTESEEN